MSTPKFESQRAAVLRRLVETNAVERLWAKDHTLFQPEPAECANRFGWLDEPTAALAEAAELLQYAASLVAAGVTDVVWCGMGGSSLFPALINNAPLPRQDGLRLDVIDTSHPAAIARSLANHDPKQTLYVFASKSGGTIETRCQLDTFAEHCSEGRFAVITDSGSALDEIATERGWTAWHANPDVGGRYSALSRFGTIATALTGIDPSLIASAALRMSDECRADRDNPGLELSAFLCAAHNMGRDKLTLITPPALDGFGAWAEQLAAESTGKHGVGITVVADEPIGPPTVYGDDRCFVTYGDFNGIADLRDAGHPVLDLGPISIAALGAELMRWMLATAWIGAVLRINPFDQPDVEAAKSGTLAALASGAVITEHQPSDVDALFGTGRDDDQIVIQAFIDPESSDVAELQELRIRLRDKYLCAVTIGIGPRYLHSTGQLHKGGPNTGLFLQILDAGTDDVAIPGRDFGFAALLTAQANGDFAALKQAGRRVVRVSMSTALALPHEGR